MSRVLLAFILAWLLMVVLRQIEIALVFCEVPRMFDLGWVAVEERRSAALGVHAKPGIRGSTKRVAYRVLREGQVIFVSHSALLHRNSAGPLKGSILTAGGETRVVARTTLAFFYQKAFFLVVTACLWWPESSLDRASALVPSVGLIGIALCLFFIVGPIELSGARREFAIDLADVEEALGLRRTGGPSAA